MKFVKIMVGLSLASVLAACAATTPAPSTVAAATIQPDPAVTPPPKPSVESLTIDFSEANATLTPEGKAQLDGAARLYRDAKPEVMIISGHTDKSGSEFDNIILSAKRAAAVKKALVDRGVPASQLQIVAIGSAEPVPTIPPSRSAVVTWR